MQILGSAGLRTSLGALTADVSTMAAVHEDCGDFRCEVHYVGLAVCGQVTGHLLSGENAADEVEMN